MVHGISDNVLTDCYGFTEDEVKAACKEYGRGDKYCDVKKWYDGYRFGTREMYNPWSIVNYLSSGRFKNYWANTGGMTILEDVFNKGTLELKNDMAGLLTDIPVRMMYAEHITYPIRYKNNNAFWSMLLNAGYLKPCASPPNGFDANTADNDWFLAELVNREVKDTFSLLIESWFTNQQEDIHRAIQGFVSYLLNGDAENVSRVLNEDLLNNPSCHDFKEENSYHMFIYGILLAVSRTYTVQSNQESGKGRSDCVIKPDDKSRSAVVVEFKHVKEKPQGEAPDLKEEALKGLKQIEEKAYVHNLKKEGYENILKYGIAFHKKSCEVVMG
jgi:hypothetical protein